MARRKNSRGWRSADCFVVGAPPFCEDYEVEADDGYDLVQLIRSASERGREFSIETDFEP